MSSIRQKWVKLLRAGALGMLVLGSSLSLAEPDEQERMQRWQSLPPEKREELMERYERFRQLPPEEQEAVKRRYHKWRELPEDERRAMRDKWQRMSPEERQGARDRWRDRDDQGERPPGEYKKDKKEKKDKKDRHRDRSSYDD